MSKLDSSSTNSEVVSLKGLWIPLNFLFLCFFLKSFNSNQQKAKHHPLRDSPKARENAVDKTTIASHSGSSPRDWDLPSLVYIMCALFQVLQLKLSSLELQTLTVTNSHYIPVPSHTSHNVTPMKPRIWTPSKAPSQIMCNYCSINLKPQCCNPSCSKHIKRVLNFSISYSTFIVLGERGAVGQAREYKVGERNSWRKKGLPLDLQQLIPSL